MNTIALVGKLPAQLLTSRNRIAFNERKYIGQFNVIIDFQMLFTYVKGRGIIVEKHYDENEKFLP